MIDVTLIVEGIDYTPYLSEYDVSHEVEKRNMITTIDGTEYTSIRMRPIIVFRLDPLSDEQSETLYRNLSRTNLNVTYTDPYLGDRQSAVMYVTSDINSSFIIRATNGNRYYKGDAISLRSKTVI